MTLDLDDLTQRLNDQVAGIDGAPDLDDLHHRVDAARRRRRRVTGTVTAALVLSLAAGSVVWSTGDDAPSVSVADTAPDGTVPATDGPVTRETPYGLLTVEVAHSDGDSAFGTTLTVGLVRPDGSTPTFTHGVGWSESTDPAAGPQIGTIALSAGGDGPSLTTIVNTRPGRYRATFADGTTDEALSVGGTLVIVGPSTLASLEDTIDDGGAPDPVAAVPNITLDRLADDGTVSESWTRNDLVATTEDDSTAPPTDPSAGCITFDSGAPGN